jgi:threonine/homoserine/homoserine lactone efflux protein
MSWWIWISYCAVCAGIFLYPSRFNLLVAHQSAARGKRVGVASAAGSALGLGISMTIASLLLIGLLILNGPVGDFLAWVAVSWLILTALWTIGTVPVRQAMADNDNVASQSAVVAFSQSLILHVLSGRFLLVFLCLLIQFCAGPNTLTIPDFIHLQITTLAMAFLSLGFYAYFPAMPIAWLKSLGRKMALRRPANKALIAGKSVKARYRKIAA